MSAVLSSKIVQKLMYLMLGIDLTQTGDQFIRSIDMQKFRKKKRYFAEIRTLPSRQQLSADNMLTLLFQFKAFA